MVDDKDEEAPPPKDMDTALEKDEVAAPPEDLHSNFIVSINTSVQSVLMATGKHQHVDFSETELPACKCAVPATTASVPPPVPDS